VQLNQPPWRWLIPGAVLMLACVALLVLALVNPVPGGVSGCEGPHIPSSYQNNFGLSDPWLRSWSHANRVRHEFWDASFAFALTALAAAALGWIIRRHRLLKVQIGLAVLLLLMVLFLATTVDPVYFTAGC
jgi:hypothetical protein